MNKELGIYNNFDAEKDSDLSAIAFRSGKVIQSAEMNELQSIEQQHRRKASDILFNQGDIVTGGQAYLDAETGLLQISAANIYLNGNIYTAPTASMIIATTGTVNIGVFLVNRYLTELDDPRLLNPAIGTRGEGEAGAYRTISKLVWGLATDDVDGVWYQIFQSVDGYLSAKEPPPQINAITQGIAQYDRDSAGGTYVISGLKVSAIDDATTGGVSPTQTFVIDAGKARVYGNSIVYPASRRFSVDADSDTASVDGEPHLSSTAEEQTLYLNRQPLASITQIRITAEKSETITHANFINTSDFLSEASVVSIISVTQGETTYTEGVDFTLESGKIDWSLPGNEPATGSNYNVVYRYIDDIGAISSTSDSVTITGAVVGSIVFISYDHYLERLDRICIDPDGLPVRLKGIAVLDRPMPPNVPDNLLLLATITQNWIKAPDVTLDGVRVIAMNELNLHSERLDTLTELIAQMRLEQSMALGESGRKRGNFADPFISDHYRDLGYTQTAVITGGVLTLPVDVSSQFYSILDHELDGDAVELMAQPLQTECMAINPYAAFDPIPATLTLNPAVDRFNNVENVIIAWVGGFESVDKIVSSDVVSLPLREIDVTVEIDGFGAGEALTSLTFDNIVVATVGDTAADEHGRLTCQFTIPPNVPSGIKAVTATGAGGSTGTAFFVGDITATTNNLIHYYRVDPLAQTFTLDTRTQIAALDLWVCTKGQRDIRIQIRETTVGIPNQTILGEATLSPDQIAIDGASRFVFSPSVLLEAQKEYALVVMSDEAEPSVAVASLGGFDQNVQQWVTAQPYQVGALLSSSNASTWTPHNDKDLTFVLYKKENTSLTKNIILGDVDLDHITDIRLFMDHQVTDSSTSVSAHLLFDDTDYTFTDSQSLALSETLTGSGQLSINLTGSPDFTPTLGTVAQVILGTIKNTANYVTRAIPAGENSRVRVLIDAFLPAGSSVMLSAAPAGTEWGDSGWQELEQVATRPLDDGLTEITLETPDLISASDIAVGLLMNGSASARCYFKNLRVLVIEGV